ncbi:MAG: MATE family efflux transporter [Bacilli bacterium]|nr:MATE family efflux transporter [Bacilli bacterium]
MNKENILGTEKITKLIKQFSIPCIISMLVNSLYNMVDQIFIGHGVGILGNGATNVVFPISVIALAISLMFGDGASAYLSLKLGEKNKEEGAKGVSTGILLALIISVVLTLTSYIFLNDLLNLFGCTEALKDYAMSYGKIIVLGLPFVIIGTTLNSIIRADGSPKYSMFSMVLGAIINIILDPIFIFIFDMGVEGAALATIISQFITFILNILYLKKLKNIKLTKENLKPNWKIIKKVTMLGTSSFITQMSIVLVIAVENNLLGKYGLESTYGSEIPITVLGIVMKISQILYSIVLGLSVGAQPIFGYNYGSRKYDRVKETLKIVLTTSIIITLISFILFQTIPDKLILIFGSGDQKYIEFACLTFRIYLMLVIANGVQMPAGIFFQSIGKSAKSAILSLSRQVLFLIPAMFLLGHYFGIKGILYSGPVADGIAFILSSIFLIVEIKNLSKFNKNEEKIEIKEEQTTMQGKKIIITIGREYGSGGRYIGKILSEKLGIKLYDKEIIYKTAKETGLQVDYITQLEQQKNKLDSIWYYGKLNNNDKIFISESNIIKEIAKKESCIIIGRCANYILKDEENLIKIFIYSDIDDKIKRSIKYYGIPENKAKKTIKEINAKRSEHYKHYTGETWNDPANYDICINSAIGVEKVAEIINNLVNKKIEKE